MRNDFYEFRPFAIMLIGLLTVVYSISTVMSLGGWIVMALAGIIVHTRLRHRGIIK
jgi:hypothetical protein